MSKLDEVIQKSLDEMDEIIKSCTPELKEEDKKEEEEKPVEKAMPPGDLPPEEVSEDAPAPEDTEQPGEEEEEEPVEGEGEPGEEPMPEEEEGFERSLEGTMKSKNSVRKALEVSEFLSELVKGISAVIGAQREDLTKSIQSTENATELLAKSFQGIAKSQAVVLQTQSELLKSVRALNDRMDTLEKQPATVRKSMQTAPTAKPIEKSFDGATPAGEPQQLSKSQAVAKLMEEYQKGNGDLRNDILALEGTGNINSVSPLAKSVLGLK